MAPPAASTTALAVICGDRVPSKLIEVASNLQNNGFRLAVLCSEVISQALLAAKVPHIPVFSPSEVQLMMTDRIELVISLTPEIDEKASKKQKQQVLDQWVAGPLAFVRTAAWNHKQIAVILEETQLQQVEEKISTNGQLGFSVKEKRLFAEKAFAYFAKLDTTIAKTLQDENGMK